jgi:tetrahydromethanopterin S-methyltransferase subunit A
MNSSTGVFKVKPVQGYPPEEGRYVRGDDYSPVAVAAILDTFESKIPVELSEIIRVAVDSGAALAGSVQTENIGIEKIIANIVANPNI